MIRYLGEKVNLKIQQSREFVDDTTRKAEFGEQTIKVLQDLAGQRWMVIQADRRS
jgi:hypothetical protein